MVADPFPLLVQVTKRRKISPDPKVSSPPKAALKTSHELAETRPASRSASKLKRRRSPSPASTDSFAEAGDWEDPAKVFLASNRQFKVPLSELGRGATLIDVPGASNSPTRASSRHVPQEPTQVDQLHTPPPKRFRASASVPTDGVQNEDILSPMSDMSTDAQGGNRSPVSDVPDDVSTPPVMSNPGSIDNLDTRTEDYQTTQPLAPEDLDIGATQVSDATDSCPRQASPQARSSMVSRPSTNTRTILSMVNPAKKWRFQRGEQLIQAALQPGSDGQTQPSEIFSVSSHAPSTGRQLFDRMAAQMRAAQQLPPQRDPGELNPPYLPHFNEDSRENAVVPDSEPSEPANTASTLSRLRSLTPPNSSLDGGRVDPSLSGLAPVPSMVVEDKGPQHEKEKDGQSDDDEEEDIPLLLTVGRQDKAAAPPSTKVGSPPKVIHYSHSHLPTPLTTIPKSKGRQSRAPERTGRGVGTKVSSIRGVHARDNEIPSSVPEQDHPSSAVPPTPPRTGPRRKGKECENTGEDAFISSTRPNQVTPTPDEDSTEPADDLPIDAEDDVIIPHDPKASSKRTRPHPAHSRKSAYRSAPRGASNTPSMISGSRSTKRIKGYPMATRVFALWKLEAAYFSGMVCERAGQSDRFKIQFDDGDEDVVDVKNLRRLELRIGDRVTIIESQEKATIANVDKQHPGIVTVRLIDDPSAEMEVEVQGIKIQSRAIGSQWGNRFINVDEIVTLIPRTKSETPSSLRNSNSLLNKTVLNKVGIVVTLSVGCDREKEKETIMRIIKTNGGTVLDDWSDVFSLAGEYSANKKRWVITSDNIGTDMKHDIQQVFLVSDAANTKPRFLTALALGIPCLSVDWLRNLTSGVSLTAGSE